MGLFRRNKNAAPVKTYSRDELFRKEKAKELMTYDEIQALNREKSKDLTNQILRVLGLFTALVLVILAVGCFLYPFSILNFIPTKGGWGMDGDTFWALTSHFPVYSHGAWHDVGWSLSQVLRGDPGFIDVFYFMSFWTIPVIATIGLIAIVIYAAYIVAYNVKDLINVIKHFFNRAGYVVSDIADAGRESVSETTDGQKKKKTTKKTTKKLPEEIKEAINEVPVPDLEVGRKEENTTVGGYSTEELDALLRGETLPEKKEEAGQKSIF